MRWNQTAEELIRQVNGFLRPLVDYREHVEAKRRELCAVLLELAAAGHAVFTPQDLLAKVNLDHTSFCNWARAEMRFGRRRDARFITNGVTVRKPMFGRLPLFRQAAWSVRRRARAGRGKPGNLRPWSRTNLRMAGWRERFPHAATPRDACKKLPKSFGGMDLKGRARQTLR